MKQLIETLVREGCSVVIRSEGQERCYWQRGVADLYRLLHDEPEVLRDAQLADKVVGKGAAALMALGGVREVYARVLSRSALQLLQEAGIRVTFGECVDHVINRAGTGWCPVETLCYEAGTPAECLPLIEAFVAQQNEKH